MNQWKGRDDVIFLETGSPYANSASESTMSSNRNSNIGITSKTAATRIGFRERDAVFDDDDDAGVIDEE